MLATDNALKSLEKLATNTTLKDDEAFNCYRTVKALINVYSDLKLCLERNGIYEQFVLERYLFEVKNNK